ncbi:MAG: diadenylate cyclase CdaA [Candidatus Melainabacteria bacterium]
MNIDFSFFQIPIQIPSKFLANEIFHPNWQFIFISGIQISVIAYLLFLIYLRLRGTQAQKTVDGILLLIPLIACSYFFKLRIFMWLFELLLPAILVGIVVLFSAEIRRFLSNLGRQGLSWLNLLTWVRSPLNQAKDDELSIKDIVKRIIEAVELFSRNKTGALIVFDNAWSERLYINSGRKLDAVISTELLLNIFYPKSPLHDGAVLILDKRIYAASVILPITENPKLNPWQYGTRHRAALGISEQSTTAFCLVVSEETGRISIAESGKISKITSIEELSAALEIKLLTLEGSQ